MAEPTQFTEITLKCACGTGIAGVVLMDRWQAALDLFRAHHTGPSCAPTLDKARPIRGLPMNRGAMPPTVTPERICRSAWWFQSTDVPERWVHANVSERRRLLLTVLDAVYVDVSGSEVGVSIRPKAAFDAVIQSGAASTSSVS